MKILSVAFDNNTTFIVEIVKKFSNEVIINMHNNNFRTDRKSVKHIQNTLGSDKLPLIMFQDENMELIGGIWPESKPDWEIELKNKIKELTE